MTPSDICVSLIFPGQGSQAVGMGIELSDTYPAAKLVFEEVDEALGQDLSGLIRNGPIEELTLTVNAQPALMAVSVAAYRVLLTEGMSMHSIRSMAGHSLGEYSAYAAAAAISVTDTARLLRIRGEAMQAAVPVGEGAMAAILGLEMDVLAEIVAAHGAEIANDNAPGQIVISGKAAAVEAACAAAKAAGAKRAMPLPVSAPFHSSLMEPAKEKMAAALASAEIAEPAVPVYANVLAGPVNDPEDIRRTLTDQVTGRVRWTESVAAMAADGTSLFVEVGSGKVLSGLVKRIASDAQSAQFGQPGDLDNLRELLAH